MKIKNHVLSLLIGVALIALCMQSSNVQGKSMSSAFKDIYTAFAQGRGRSQAQPRGNRDAMGGGHIPAHGPAPFRAQPPAERSAPRAAAPAAPNFADRPGHPNAPHVHANDRWIGHDSGPNDQRLHLDHPWNMDALPVALDAAMSSGCRAGTGSGSGLTVTTSAYS
jgi:hypothetical protein